MQNRDPSRQLFAILAAAILAGLSVTVAGPMRAAEVNVSLAGGIFQPWEGDSGHSVTLSALVPLERRRMWIGVELEQRSFDARITNNFQPGYDSFIARGLFHFHPLPEARISPYVGVGVGLALHVADRDSVTADVRTRRRDRVSGGTTFLVLAGAQTRLLRNDSLSVFAEVRLESVTDLWKKSGAGLRYSQIGGVMGVSGLRLRF